MEYIVGMDLPLPPSYSGLSTKEAAKNTAFRKHLSRLIGNPIVLTGSSTANPNYKVKATFSSEQEAQDLADRLSQAVSEGISEGKVIYGYMSPEVKKGNAGWVYKHIPQYGSFWG